MVAYTNNMHPNRINLFYITIQGYTRMIILRNRSEEKNTKWKWCNCN